MAFDGRDPSGSIADGVLTDRRCTANVEPAVNRQPAVRFRLFPFQRSSSTRSASCGILRKDASISNLYTIDPATADHACRLIQGSNNAFPRSRSPATGVHSFSGSRRSLFPEPPDRTGHANRHGRCQVGTGCRVRRQRLDLGSFWVPRPCKTGLYRIDPPLARNASASSGARLRRACLRAQPWSDILQCQDICAVAPATHRLP
jgi:hypothetical protein